MIVLTLVIGVGMAVAYGLARAGERVRLLDEGDDAFRAARGNFGLVWVQSKGPGKPAYGRWTLAAAVFCPLDGHVSPLRPLRAPFQGFQNMDGELLPGVHVDTIEQRGGEFRVRTGDTYHVAGKLVLAAGLGNRELAPLVGLEAPVQPKATDTGWRWCRSRSPAPATPAGGCLASGVFCASSCTTQVHRGGR